MRVHVVTLRYSPTLGAFDPSPLTEFLRDKEVLSFREQFFRAEGVPHLLCVIAWRTPDGGARTTAPPTTKPAPRDRAVAEQRPDPTADLSEADRLVFDAIRQWRAGVAREEGVPAYLVLKNKQVLELIAKRPASLTALTQIEGVGKGKVERYGKAILDLLHGAAPATEDAPS